MTNKEEKATTISEQMRFEWIFRNIKDFSEKYFAENLIVVE